MTAALTLATVAFSLVLGAVMAGAFAFGLVEAAREEWKSPPRPARMPRSLCVVLWCFAAGFAWVSLACIVSLGMLAMDVANGGVAL